MKKLYLLLYLFFGLQIFSSAQDKISVGASGFYNFALESYGFGIRGVVPVHQRISLVPHFIYVPKNNDVHEYYAGLNIHLILIRNTVSKGYKDVVKPQKPQVYLTMGVDYNRWISYNSLTISPKAKTNNIVPMVGMGAAAGGNILRFFMEGKYNPIWKEPNAEIGVLVFPYKQNKTFKCP